MSIGASSSTTESFTLIQAPRDDPNVAEQHQVLADFSSIGPCADNRRGITLLSPGYYIISANSDQTPTPGHTGLSVKAGTSMATPVTAGYAALVRQYFREGFYPLGAKSATMSFIPRGALIEAMMVNSAQHMTGTFAGITGAGARNAARTQFNANQRPSTVQGFGRLQLDRSMRLTSSKGNWISLAVGALGDTASMVSTGESKTFKIAGVKADNGVGTQISLKVTLVWHDPAGSANAQQSLINDLDLTVTTPGGQTVLPQSEGDGPTTAAASTATDQLNSVEQVVIATPQAGDYTIIVTGRTVPQGPQPFAIVATWGTGATSAGDASGANSEVLANGLGISIDSATVKGLFGLEKGSAGEVFLIIFIIIICLACCLGAVVLVVLLVVMVKRNADSKEGGTTGDSLEMSAPKKFGGAPQKPGSSGGGSKKKKRGPPPMPPKKKKPPMPPKKKKRQVRAKWAYDATEDDELSFAEDAVITVLDTSDPDWHKGRVGQSVGMYPSAYVVPV